MGPIGILAADSLMGEITPTMAVAIGRSDAKKLPAAGESLQQSGGRNPGAVAVPSDG